MYRTRPESHVQREGVASDYCFEGLRGPLCHVCVEAAQYYDAASARCVGCGATGEISRLRVSGHSTQAGMVS